MAERPTGEEMSESERLEVNRRTDVALAVIPVACRYLKDRAQLEEQITAKAKKSNSYWYGIFLLGV